MSQIVLQSTHGQEDGPRGHQTLLSEQSPDLAEDAERLKTNPNLLK